MTIEREVLWTGIGGQGVQLAAKILALAATHEGREVMSLGTYGGTMRGGNTDATLVIADGAITAPPMVSKAWAAIIAHPRFADPLFPKLRGDGAIFVDADLLEGPLPESNAEVVALSATKLAREIEAPKAAALILLGAFAQATGIVGPDALATAAASALPSYRQQFLEANQRALSAGVEAVSPLTLPAWQERAA